MKNKILCVVLALIAALCCGCGTPGGENYGGSTWDGGEFAALQTGDRFSVTGERGFVNAAENGESAFSLTSGYSSYAYMRRCVSRRRLPAQNSVRAEEYINYFKYGVNGFAGDFGVAANVYSCPWNSGNLLLRVTVQAREVDKTNTESNLVFLVDTSASMYGEDRLGLFSTAVSYVASAMGERDKISIITYGGSCRVLIDGADFTERDRITLSAAELEASGSTYGSKAIEIAYKTAQKHFIRGGDNRIILFTDGDFNVGASSVEELKKLVARYNESDVSLSCVGVGFGNYSDETLEALAREGNGTVYYVDGEDEAKRVFGEELTGTLYTVARKAKAKLTFNAEAVSEYRLIGYDNRRLTSIQFEDDETDGGDIGSGTQATALYEIKPLSGGGGAYADFTLRYESGGNMRQDSVTVNSRNADGDDLFIACVAEYALLLRNSAYRGDADFNGILNRLKELDLSDARRAEFAELVAAAAEL